MPNRRNIMHRRNAPNPIDLRSPLISCFHHHRHDHNSLALGEFFLIDLVPGFTESRVIRSLFAIFADLTITGSNGNTLISSGNELLATLTGIYVSLIDSTLL